MIFPYKKPRPERTLAYLLDHKTVLRENGHEGRLTDALRDKVQVWGDAGMLRDLTRGRDGHGSAVLWRFVAIGWSPERDAKTWPVRGLQIEQPDPHETIRGLKRWRDWLQSYGAAPAGSLGGSGLSLLKATLTQPLFTSGGDVPPITYTMGGRQYTRPPNPRLIAGELRHSDIAAAYASTLGSVRYGGLWQRYDAIPETLPANALCYVRALVDVPETIFGEGPLPIRPRKAPAPAAMLFWDPRELYPCGRRIQGTWTLRELEAALAGGCKLRKLLDVWVHRSSWQPFLPWFEAVWKGRELTGFAGTLAKATGNATWGQLAIAKGVKKVVNGQGRDEPLKLRGGNPSQRAFDLAEWIAGSVRGELYAGMSFAGERLICAHTDGLWADGRVVPGWRVKRSRDADELRLIDAQHLSYRLDGGEWEYVVAGVLDPGEWFEERWARYERRGEVAA